MGGGVLWYVLVFFFFKKNITANSPLPLFRVVWHSVKLKEGLTTEY